jgi:hypothetical protein
MRKEKRIMMTFTIDPENSITAYASKAEAPTKLDSKIEHFTSEKKLAQLASDWPMTRLVDIWNSLAGVIPVRKFTDRKKAVARIWRAIQSLVPATTAPEARTAAPAKSRKGKKPTSSTKSDTAREGSKKEQVLEMLRQSDGATLEDLMVATEWQAHSVRGFLSGVVSKKLGMEVLSTRRPDGLRTYRVISE